MHLLNTIITLTWHQLWVTKWKNSNEICKMLEIKEFFCTDMWHGAPVGSEHIPCLHFPVTISTNNQYLTNELMERRHVGWGESFIYRVESSTHPLHLLLVEGNIFTKVIHHTWDFLFFLIWCYFRSRPLPGSGERRCPVPWWMVTEVLRLWSTARRPSWNKPPAPPAPQTGKGYGAMFSDTWCNTTSRRYCGLLQM